MRKNVLISTTRQWNPGDEFIMFGSMNILEYCYGDIFNPIIFNRNPDIRTTVRNVNRTRNYKGTLKWDYTHFKGRGLLNEIFRIGQFDNSYKDDMDSYNIDLAVFAGSPEWYNWRLTPMYKSINEAEIPTVFLGLGVGDSFPFENVSAIVTDTLRKSNLITARDRQTEEMLSKYGAIYLPCPALLASKREHIVREVNKIGLIYATNETLKGNRVSFEMHQYIAQIYKKLSKKYNTALVCHYIDEIDLAKSEFPELDIYYSFDAKDYEKIYNNFDLVIGGRVHGIGMSASLGIPGIMIKHDSRSSTTDGFLAKQFDVGTNYNILSNYIDELKNNIAYYSEKIVEHKYKTLEEYKKLFIGSDLFCK